MVLVGESDAFKGYENSGAAGIQLHCAVYGAETVVVTVSHPVIAVIPILNVTSPGTEAVAVIVSTAP
jgi:hypothetical protein